MPKRIVDGDALWTSNKLAKLPEDMRAEYANLLPLALGNGSFECDPRIVWHTVYGYNRANVTLERVIAILDELERAGLLVRWTQDEKLWGYWVGIEKPGRLPPLSRTKHEKRGPEPPSPTDGEPTANHRITTGNPSFRSQWQSNHKPVANDWPTSGFPLASHTVANGYPKKTNTLNNNSLTAKAAIGEPVASHVVANGCIGLGIGELETNGSPLGGQRLTNGQPMASHNLDSADCNEKPESARAEISDIEDHVRRLREIGFRRSKAITVEQEFAAALAAGGDADEIVKACCRIYVWTEQGKYVRDLTEAISRWDERRELWMTYDDKSKSGKPVTTAPTKTASELYDEQIAKEIGVIHERPKLKHK